MLHISQSSLVRRYIKIWLDKWLDLIFTNAYDDCTVIATDPLVKTEVHHEAVSITIKNSVSTSSSCTEQCKFDFSKADYPSIEADLCSCDWTFIFLDEAEFSKKYVSILDVLNQYLLFVIF